MSNWQPHYDPDIDCKELNLVLSPGRMATTTLYRWLNANGVRAFKTHVMDKDVAARRVKQRRQKKQRVPLFLEQAMQVLDTPLDTADPVRVVLPLREPLDRNLSAFRRFVSSGRVKLSEDMSDAHVRALFEESVPVDRLDNWLAHNLFPILSRSELEGLMSPERPITWLNRGRFQFMLMRCEASDTLKAEALTDFVGQPIKPRNRTETARMHNKSIPNTLQEKLDRLPEYLFAGYREDLYRSVYTRTFYPEYAIYDVAVLAKGR
jgi:hypothetical protein